jgi:DNA topoisomerase-2
MAPEYGKLEVLQDQVLQRFPTFKYLTYDHVCLGLGTSSAKEAKEYFTEIKRHRIKFKYSGQPDDEAVDLAFSKKKIDERKTWLTQWMTVRKQRREQGEFEDYLYERDTHSITFSDFVNKELVLFSNTDNERSIPSLVDGLKPGQRKVHIYY